MHFKIDYDKVVRQKKRNKLLINLGFNLGDDKIEIEDNSILISIPFHSIPKKTKTTKH